MNIGRVAEQAGLTVKTVRYYSDIGIVAPYQDQKQGIVIMRQKMWPSCNSLVRHDDLISVLRNAESFYRFIRIKIGPTRR